MDIINASKTTKYKVFKWLLVGLGAAVFIVGIVLNVLGKNVVATAISFECGNKIEQGIDGVWRMNVWTLETPLIVNTEPGNLTKTPVRFATTSVGANFIENIAPIRSGRPAEIRLKSDANGIYNYGGVVRVTVFCGNAQEILEIKILPPSDQISVRVGIKEGETPLSLVNGAFEISETTYLNNLQKVQGEDVSYYKLSLGLYIYNAPIQDLVFREECTDEEDIGVTLEERKRWKIEGITLLGYDSEISTDRGLLIDYEYLQPGADYNFRVSCTFLGQEYFKLIALRITE